MRYLTIVGEQLSLRYALPLLGQVRIGSGQDAEVRLIGQGLRDVHVVLELGTAVRCHMRGPGNELDGDIERRLEEGQAMALIGPVCIEAGRIMLSVVDVKNAAPARRILCSTALSDLIELRDAPAVLYCIRGADIEGPLVERAPPGAAIFRSAGDDYLVLADAEGDERWLREAGFGPAVGIGTATTQEAPAAGLASLAASRIRAALPVSSGPCLTTRSPSMRDVLDQISRVATSRVPVLVLGETGAGKGLVARAIHDRSSMASEPFMTLDCAALGESLVEELQAGIGHSSGTIVLDEVSDIAFPVQAKLSKLLERESELGFRVLATSNRNLAEHTESGTFLKDLYFRLSRFVVRVPPLRQRSEDIVPIAEAIIDRLAAGTENEPPTLGEDLKRRLLSHAWPGNVRELSNTLEGAFINGGGAGLSIDHLPARPAADAQTAPVGAAGASLSLKDELAALEKRRILEALRDCPTQTEAAKALEMPLRTFLNRLDSFGIPRSRKKRASTDAD